MTSGAGFGTLTVGRQGHKLDRFYPMCLSQERKKTLQSDSKTAICVSFGIEPDLFELIMMDAPTDKLEVIVMTVPKNDALWEKKIAGCRTAYADPFIVRFAIPAGFASGGLEESEIIRYPSELFGDLLATRTWIEKAQTRVFLLSDDDPGVSYAGREYGFRPTQMIFTCPGCNASGGHRWTITSQVYHDVWRFGIALARQRGSNYLGVNGSEATKGIFCDTKFLPVACNRIINGVVAVIKGIRSRIPQVKISQEFALTTAFANAQGGGTMTLMPLIRTYAVNAPKMGSVEHAQEVISELCGQQFKRGNTGGGIGASKHNAIFHSTTAQTMTVQELLEV